MIRDIFEIISNFSFSTKQAFFMFIVPALQDNNKIIIVMLCRYTALFVIKPIYDNKNHSI